MRDHYLEGEERFGPFMSFIYSIASALPLPRIIYTVAKDDIISAHPDSVIDIGCGPGDLLKMISDRKGIELFGVDPSEWMIKAAMKRVSGRDIKLAIGSSRSIPFRRKFTIITSTLSFHHWEKRTESLRYLSRFLQKDGTIRIYEMEKRGFAALGPLSKHAMTEAELRESAKKAGMRVKRIKRQAGVICAILSVR